MRPVSFILVGTLGTWLRGNTKWGAIVGEVDADRKTNLMLAGAPPRAGVASALSHLCMDFQL